jgi:anthranilate synthase component 1
MPSLSEQEFIDLVRAERSAAGAGGGGPSDPRTLMIPLAVALLEDQVTPVLAYRRLVAPDERTAPSFLFESVEGGERQGRYSILGSRPVIEVVAYGHETRTTDRRSGAEQTCRSTEPNPLSVPRAISSTMRLVQPPHRGGRGGGGGGLPGCMLGGWVGFAGYDTVRYAEPLKLASPPPDDRHLPDLHLGFYDGIVVFDHVDKLVYLVQLTAIAPGDDPLQAYQRMLRRLDERVAEIQRHSKPLPAGRVERETASPSVPLPSNLTRDQHAAMVAKAKEYIRAGDIFQVVLGQRFERKTSVDPFDVYRALRAVNPSPYMVYLQAEGCILVASSPEILCRVRREPATPTSLQGRMIVTNRPLAGTRRRGATPEEDQALERELLADQKERAEHIMLVDLGRNDVGKVCKPGTVELPALMQVERYSHVMHISSTVTGELREGLDAWDALAATLPVGTISGAPKIRAMQIIDELEPVRRGPYGGGMGYVGLDGQMDIALALRTIVVPTAGYKGGGWGWTYHLQAAGGIVADSDAAAEYQETVNKAAAMARAIEMAERAFGGPE